MLVISANLIETHKYGVKYMQVYMFQIWYLNSKICELQELKKKFFFQLFTLFLCSTVALTFFFLIERTGFLDNRCVFYLLLSYYEITVFPLLVYEICRHEMLLTWCNTQKKMEVQFQLVHARTYIPLQLSHEILPDRVARALNLLRYIKAGRQLTHSDNL